MKISVIIPVHNGEQTLERTVSSIMRQTFPIAEIFIILNNCTDNSHSLALEISRLNQNIHVHVEDKQGAGAARNRGLDLSTGDLVAFCDCDDEWLPDKIETQVNIILATGASFCCSSYNVCNSKEILRVQTVVSPLNYERLLNKAIVVGCSTVIIKRLDIGNIRFTNLKMRQDFVFFCEILKRLLEQQKFGCIVEEPKVNYFVSNSSLSSNKFKAAMYQYLAYRKLGFGSIKSMTLCVKYALAALKVRLIVN